MDFRLLTGLCFLLSVSGFRAERGSGSCRRFLTGDRLVQNCAVPRFGEVSAGPDG
jgi:hypothetical protein